MPVKLCFIKETHITLNGKRDAGFEAGRSLIAAGGSLPLQDLSGSKRTGSEAGCPRMGFGEYVTITVASPFFMVRPSTLKRILRVQFDSDEV